MNKLIKIAHFYKKLLTIMLHSYMVSYTSN